MAIRTNMVFRSKRICYFSPFPMVRNFAFYVLLAAHKERLIHIHSCVGRRLMTVRCRLLRLVTVRRWWKWLKFFIITVWLASQAAIRRTASGLLCCSNSFASFHVCKFEIRSLICRIAGTFLKWLLDLSMEAEIYLPLVRIISCKELKKDGLIALKSTINMDSEH